MLLSSRCGVRGGGIAEVSRPLEKNREANTELGSKGGLDQAGLSYQGHTQHCCASLLGEQPHVRAQVLDET